MMALPQETILRIAWPHRLFSAKKSTILRKISYSGPGHRECVTGFRAGVFKSSDETRSVDTLATPLKDLQPKKKKRRKISSPLKEGGETHTQYFSSKFTEKKKKL